MTGKELINSTDKDYLDIIINIDEPKAYFKKPELVETTVKRIAVPIKQDLLENYVYWINYYNAVESDDFYNIGSGGEGGKTIVGYSEEQMERYKE